MGDQDQSLGDLIKQESVLTFNPECVRKKSNWSKTSNVYKLDDGAFDPAQLLSDIRDFSPKLDAMLKKIRQVDAADMRDHGHLHKHFIFCDLKSASYGAKLLAAACIANDLVLGYGAELKGAKKEKETVIAKPPSPQETPRVSIKRPKRQDTPIPGELIAPLHHRLPIERKAEA